MNRNWLLSPFIDVNKKKSSYGENVNILDGIRGLAVLIVLASHTNSFGMYAQGSLGVMLFFFLSGYVLSIPFVEDPKKILNFDKLKRYSANRLLRIVPIYLIIAALTAVFLNKNFSWYLWNVSFIKGWNHFWSVAQEIRFYILFPLIITILSLTNNKTFRVLLLFLFTSLAYYCKNAHNIDMLDGRHVHFYFFMFTGGSFTCFLVDLLKKNTFIFNDHTKKIFLYLTFLIFLFIIFSSQYMFLNFWSKFISNLPKGYAINGWSHPVLWLFLFLIFFLSLIIFKAGIIHKLLTNYIFRHIGLLSYSMYLIHMLMIIKLNKYGFQKESLFLVVFITSYIFSLLSYVIIEKPFLILKIKN